MEFDNPKVYGDTSITDGLVFLEVVPFLTLFHQLFFLVRGAFHRGARKKLGFCPNQVTGGGLSLTNKMFMSLLG